MGIFHTSKHTGPSREAPLEAQTKLQPNMSACVSFFFRSDRGGSSGHDSRAGERLSQATSAAHAQCNGPRVLRHHASSQGHWGLWLCHPHLEEQTTIWRWVFSNFKISYRYVHWTLSWADHGTGRTNHIGLVGCDQPKYFLITFKLLQILLFRQFLWYREPIEIHSMNPKYLGSITSNHMTTRTVVYSGKGSGSQSWSSQALSNFDVLARQQRPWSGRTFSVASVREHMDGWTDSKWASVSALERHLKWVMGFLFAAVNKVFPIKETLQQVDARRYFSSFHFIIIFCI